MDLDPTSIGSPVSRRQSELGTTLIASILFEYGVRIPARRDGRSRDDEALRNSFELFFPGAQWVGDGKQLAIVIDGKTFHRNLELVVDAASGAAVGISVRDEEDSAAVVQAFTQGVQTTGGTPLALLLDNRPSNHTPQVDAALDDTLRIRATLGRPQNKAHVEGCFGLFAQKVPPIVLDTMRELNVAKLPEYVEEDVRVSEWSTVRVKHCAYSVPSRLKGKWVRARIFEDKIEVRFADVVELACERLIGRNLCRIDYRHVIWSLIRKPGAFARYVYREEMFPSLAFREAYDGIQALHAGTKGDLEYLRILHLAASTMEADVAVALSLLQMARKAITAEAVKEMIASTPTSIDVPQLASPPVTLSEYDALLTEVAA